MSFRVFPTLLRPLKLGRPISISQITNKCHIKTVTTNHLNYNTTHRISAIKQNNPFRNMASLLNTNNASIRTYSSSSPRPQLVDNADGTLKRWSWRWWTEWTIIFAVFAVTGSTTVRVVRPIVTNVFGIEGKCIENAI